jgi:hypothetical protein
MWCDCDIPHDTPRNHTSAKQHQDIKGAKLHGSDDRRIFFSGKMSELGIVL